MGLCIQNKETNNDTVLGLLVGLQFGLGGLVVGVDKWFVH